MAAISLSSGDAIADPFSRTKEIQGILELRLAQLKRREHSLRRGLGVPTQARARASLAGSPPGAGGRLLTLPRAY